MNIKNTVSLMIFWACTIVIAGQQEDNTVEVEHNPVLLGGTHFGEQVEKLSLPADLNKDPDKTPDSPNNSLSNLDDLYKYPTEPTRMSPELMSELVRYKRLTDKMRRVCKPGPQKESNIFLGIMTFFTENGVPVFSAEYMGPANYTPNDSFMHLIAGSEVFYLSDEGKDLRDRILQAQTEKERKYLENKKQQANKTQKNPVLRLLNRLIDSMMNRI